MYFYGFVLLQRAEPFLSCRKGRVIVQRESLWLSYKIKPSGGCAGESIALQLHVAQESHKQDSILVSKGEMTHVQQS